MIKIFTRKGFTVPDGVFIAPKQAWVDGMAQMLPTYGNGSGLNLASINATSFLVDGGTSLARLMGGVFASSSQGGSYDFSGNHVATAGEINYILSALAGFTVTNGAVNVSGGTMAAPTPAQVHLDEIYILDFNGIDLAAILAGGVPVQFQITAAVVASAFIVLDPTIDFGQSSSVYENITVGVSNLGGFPTIAQIAAYVAAQFANIFASSAVDHLDGTLTMTDSNEANYPYAFADAGSGITSTETQAGEAFQQNAAITTLQGAGTTVITN